MQITQIEWDHENKGRFSTQIVQGEPNSDNKVDSMACRCMSLPVPPIPVVTRTMFVVFKTHARILFLAI